MFFARCLAPLARVVANSVPAAAAWYGLVNGKTLAGTGFPCHPWVSSTDSIDGLSPSCCPVPTAADAIGGGTQGAESLGGKNDEEGSELPGHDDKDKEEALFLSMSSAANSDEWSAMLVGAGLVRSLVDSLQACLDVRIVARGANRSKESLVASVDDFSAKGTSSVISSASRPQSDVRKLQPFVVETGGPTACGLPAHGCLGCDVEAAQVVVVIAIGALLSAHPLATRDRLQLAGGIARLHGVTSHKPDHRRDDFHACVSFQGERRGSASTAFVLPFLPEHCALVALQVLRLCLRADSSSSCVPPDIVGGAARLAGALSLPILSTWGKCLVGSSPVGEGETRSLRPHHMVDREQFEEGSGDNEYRQGVMSQKLLPLGCPEDVAAPEVAGSFGFVGENGVCAQAASSWDTRDPAEEPRSSLGSFSYRLCG